MLRAVTPAPPADTCWSRTCHPFDDLTNWMATYLARIGVTVFALLFAIALVTERPAAGHGLVEVSEVRALAFARREGSREDQVQG